MTDRYPGQKNFVRVEDIFWYTHSGLLATRTYISRA